LDRVASDVLAKMATCWAGALTLRAGVARRRAWRLPADQRVPIVGASARTVKAHSAPSKRPAGPLRLRRPRPPKTLPLPAKTLQEPRQVLTWRPSGCLGVGRTRDAGPAAMKQDNQAIFAREGRKPFFSQLPPTRVRPLNRAQ
jgi:hypothetical protein